jgi:hypothetical protein
MAVAERILRLSTTLPAMAQACFEDPRGVYLRNEAPADEYRLILIGTSAARLV